MREKLMYAIHFCKAIDNDVRVTAGALLGAISREESAMEEAADIEGGNDTDEDETPVAVIVQPFLLHAPQHTVNTDFFFIKKCVIAGENI